MGQHHILPYLWIPQPRIMCIMARDIIVTSMYMVSMVIIIIVTIMQVASSHIHMQPIIPYMSKIQNITATTWVVKCCPECL